ncbi:MAG: hypothetical protein OXE41_00755 [Gammaproteobacteria bacterium]|nr:hypothetical protein [Gammaproteobacteria bacterium]MCY4273921.1 hypothetical protein [Gammaproteobacteria bacterium]
MFQYCVGNCLVIGVNTINKDKPTSVSASIGFNPSIRKAGDCGFVDHFAVSGTKTDDSFRRILLDILPAPEMHIHEIPDQCENTICLFVLLPDPENNTVPPEAGFAF